MLHGPRLFLHPPALGCGRSEVEGKGSERIDHTLGLGGVKKAEGHPTYHHQSGLSNLPSSLSDLSGLFEPFAKRSLISFNNFITPSS